MDVEAMTLSDDEIALQTKVAQKRALIANLKAQLDSTDYQIIKMYEYSLVGEEQEYDAAALHTSRQALRDQINVLETELQALVEG